MRYALALAIALSITTACNAQQWRVEPGATKCCFWWEDRYEMRPVMTVDPYTGQLGARLQVVPYQRLRFSLFGPPRRPMVLYLR